MRLIDLENGKYSVDLEHLVALRYGETWRDLRGDKLVLVMGFEIERLRGQFEVAVQLLSAAAGPLEVSAAVIEDEDGGEAMETLIDRVKAFCAAATSAVPHGVLDLGAVDAARMGNEALANAAGVAPSSSVAREPVTGRPE